MWPNFVIFFLFAAFSLHVGSTSQSRNLTSQDLLYAIRNGTHWFNIAVSGETDIFPPFDVFKNLAQALYQFPSTERNREENEEYRKLRCAMLKLSKAINSSYEFVGSFMNKKWLDVGWWKKGIIAGAQKFLSAAEFRDSAKQDAALCLKNHLEENYGYSYWPQKEVHRFGVVIFSDSFAYTPGIEEELSVALFWWEEQSAYVLIYKSTFGEETYHENKQFHAEHIREIEDRFHNISTTGSCFQLFDYTAPVANALLPVLNSAKSLNNKLYYFWLSTDKLKDTDWINAVDVGVAGSPVQSFNASAVATFEAELHVSYCFGLKTAKLPVLVFVGY
ncbi:hypothetical protein QR680_015122 [Steinernema hermaphroditum]|uniref:Uncharacterized protein n=1 Tax=Steinernema hermaphroditum TaxID=289476 RepID=A0AA39IDV6_9BILA|nr:hypothetical protein QR680_015122 [Steinernema hermaphroditum]